MIERPSICKIGVNRVARVALPARDRLGSIQEMKGIWQAQEWGSNLNTLHHASS
jgi:hypothetical protein